ncbi:hypothetical protein [Haematobacter genomosp. 1]|uniref:Uncharacterized protein n=1 Tax=Haematobacter genomosp. 1 TaxID=366618 RepID=A0A212AAL6_9RHOB|nr:hypothetical protein [Haematobacter genomosp. 1]OWJ77041.1 hypothetical protein CDV49_12910 [Haematobacter genomosp. 1]
MLLKIAIFFLAAVVLLGFLGQMRWFRPTRKQQPPQISKPQRCGDCGTWLIGRKTCPCKDKA